MENSTNPSNETIVLGQDLRQALNSIQQRRRSTNPVQNDLPSFSTTDHKQQRSSIQKSPIVPSTDSLNGDPFASLLTDSLSAVHSAMQSSRSTLRRSLPPEFETASSMTTYQESDDDELDYIHLTSSDDQDDGFDDSDESEDGFISLKTQKELMGENQQEQIGLINAKTIQNHLSTFLPMWIPSNQVDLYHFYHADVFQRLHNEIVMFYDYLKPTPTEAQARQHLVERLQSVITDIFPQARLIVFGSTATHTALPFGDVDFVLFHPPDQQEQQQLDQRERIVKEYTQQRNNSNGSRRPPPMQIPECTYSARIFNLIAIYLQNHNMVDDVEIVSTARVPVMKFVDRQTGLHVDITINSDSGLQAASYMESQMQLFPQLRPLTMVLKYFLYLRGLNEAFTGGIGSFVLQCLIIGMLKTHPSLFKQQNVIKQRSVTKNKFDTESHVSAMFTPTSNLGVLLFSFFRLYAIDFNYCAVQLDLATAMTKSKTSKKQHSSATTDLTPCVVRAPISHGNSNSFPFLKAINPLDSSHDMAANSFNFVTIRGAFLFAYQTILRHLIVADQSDRVLELLAEQQAHGEIPPNVDINNCLDSQIYGTLLSELLPSCPDLVSSRPPLITLPQPFLSSRQFVNFQRETRSFFGQNAQHFLQQIVSGGVVDNTGDFEQKVVSNPQLSDSATLSSLQQITQEDNQSMTKIDTSHPQHISLQPTDIYILMKRAYTFSTLAANTAVFEKNLEACSAAAVTPSDQSSPSDPLDKHDVSCTNNESSIVTSEGVVTIKASKRQRLSTNTIKQQGGGSAATQQDDLVQLDAAVAPFDNQPHHKQQDDAIARNQLVKRRYSSQSAASEASQTAESFAELYILQQKEQFSSTIEHAHSEYESQLDDISAATMAAAAAQRQQQKQQQKADQNQSKNRSLKQKQQHESKPSPSNVQTPTPSKRRRQSRNHQETPPSTPSTTNRGTPKKTSLETPKKGKNEQKKPTSTPANTPKTTPKLSKKAKRVAMATAAAAAQAH